MHHKLNRSENLFKYLGLSLLALSMGICIYNINRVKEAAICFFSGSAIFILARNRPMLKRQTDLKKILEDYPPKSTETIKHDLSSKKKEELTRQFLNRI
tara:strand:+ start:114 stop:410 length:297 start_codon:yes stop_codon:yes gene_type:complete